MTTKRTPKPSRLRAARITISVPAYMAAAARKSGNPSRYFQRLWERVYGKKETPC